MVRMHAAFAVAFAGVFAVGALGGCFGSGMESAPVRTGTNPRSDAALTVATREGCPIDQLRVVAETGRRYVNETAFRFVIEGCGERLGFVEQCDLGLAGPDVFPINDSLGCRYVLVSKVQLKAAPAK